MKVALVFLAVLGISCALPAVKYSLKDDLQDFLDLIPTEKVKEILEKYKNDPDVIKIHEYIKSDEFGKVVEIVKHVPEVRNIVSYIEDHGVPIIELINKIAEKLHLPGWNSYSRVYGHSTRNLRGLIDELKSIVSVDEFLALALDKLSNSEDFQGLFDLISSVDGNRLHDQALQHPEIRDLISRMNAMGIDTKKIWESLKSILGWDTYALRHTRHTYSLRDDLNDFLALIPVDKVKAVAEKYKDDPDTQMLLAYVHSEEFGKIVYYLTSLPEAKDLVNFMESKGLKVIELYNKIADKLGLPHWSGYAYGKSTYSARQFLDEVLALIPKDEVIALALDKLSNSPDFGEMFEKVCAIDGPKLLEEAKTHPEIVNCLNMMRSLGVDLEKVWAIPKTVCGWE